MAYDAARGHVVLFGGGDGPMNLLADTWEYDGTSWVETTPATSPIERYRHALAYDAARGRVILFGGSFMCYFSMCYSSGTWEYDGTSWVTASPVLSPYRRCGHALAYDAIRERVVLFGGMYHENLGMGLGISHYYNDTWEYDGISWVETTPAISPQARYYHALAYDAANGRVVLFGGEDSSTNALGDTWEYYYQSAWPDEVCDSGVDDDSDGLVDCEDPDCEGQPCNGGTCSGGVCL